MTTIMNKYPQGVKGKSMPVVDPELKEDRQEVQIDLIQITPMARKVSRYQDRNEVCQVEV